jgi:hypothetical protein
MIGRNNKGKLSESFFTKPEKEDVMKGMRILMSTLAVLVAAAPNAFAAETVRVFSSSILVLAFVGFLALIVVVQLIPAMVTLFAALKGLAKKTEETKVAEVKAGN